MNGRTKHDPTLNPCTAEADRKTYGIPGLNICFWGKRWVRIGLLFLSIELYPKTSRVPGRSWFYCRIRNAATLFFPLGSITWPMPKNPKAMS